MLVSSKHKMWKPFWSISVPGVRSSCASRKSLWDMRKPRIWLLHRPEFPRHRAWYMPAIPDESRSVSKPTPKFFTVMVPPTQHGIWIVQLRTQSYLPPSSFPRYIASEIGRGRYKCTNVLVLFSKNCPGIPPMIERSTQDVSFPFPSFITLGTHPCGLFQHCDEIL